MSAADLDLPDTANPLLCVCIPTYKRPDQLLRCVRSVIAAASPYRVPVLIADDSADETNAEAIAALQALYPLVLYVRNPVNLGIDGNILRCADLCPCGYAWLLGEDDRLLPDAVGRVLAVLKRDEPAFLAVNYSSVNEAVSVVIKDKLMDISADLSLPAEEFLTTYAPAVGFIGGCVIRKALWDMVDPAPYLGTYFAHVGRILASVRGRRVSLIAAPLVLNRAGSAAAFTWSDDAYGVYTGWAKVILRLAPIYGAAACRECIAAFDRLHGLNTVRFMMAKRADRIYHLGIYRQFIHRSDRGWGYKGVALLVAVSPPPMFRALHALLALVRQRRNRKVELPI